MWNRRLLGQIASWIAIATGAAHSLGHYGMMHAQTDDATGKQLLELLRTWKDPDLGRTMFELMLGFSLTFCILPVTLGAIVLLVMKHADERLATAVLRVAAAGLAAMSITGLTYWFAVPNAFLLAAFSFYAASLLAPWRTH